MRALLLLGALASSPAWARPVVLPLQGQLTDAGGVPIDGVVGVTFRLYGDPTPNLTMHTEHLDVDLVTGAFTVYLGSGELLDSSLFNLDQDIWLGIQVDGDIEMELVRVGWTPLAAYAAHAADAETLDGYGSADFLAASWRPSWGDIADRPPGLDDGDDVGAAGTSWTIGAGLVQTGDELSVDPTAIYSWAEQVCYDSVTELRQSLDAVYLGAAWRPTWADVSGKPAGFADDVDDDTRYTAGDGLSLTGTTFSADWAAVDVRVRQIAYDTEAELHAALDDEYKAASYVPAWTELSGVPAGFADGQDDGGPTYVAGDGIEIVGSTISAAPASIDTPAEVVAAADPSFIDPDELEAALAPYATEDEVDAAVTAASANDARVAALEAQLQAALDAIAALQSGQATLTTQVTTLQGEHAALTTEVTTLRTEHDALASSHAALASDHAALASDHAALASSHEALASDHAALEARVATLEDEAVRFIDTSVTYDIPADFADLHAALAWLEEYRIASAATVTLRLARGTHVYDRPVLVGHPDARSIAIVGDDSAPELVVLQALAGSSAESRLIDVGRGVYLQQLRGLTLSSANAAAGQAIFAHENGGIGLGERLRVNGFYYGIHASTGGTVNLPGVVVNGSTTGILASGEGHVRADNASVSPASTELGAALHAVNGGNIIALNAITHGGQYGALASHDSYIYADSGRFDGAGYIGAYAQYGSTVNVDRAQVYGMDDDQTFGYLSQFNSSLSAYQSTLLSPVTSGYRAGFGASLSAPYAIANSQATYLSFVAEYGAALHAPYSTTRTSYIGYYSNASSVNAYNSSSTGGAYGYYTYSAGSMLASDSVASGMSSYGYYAAFNAHIDHANSSGSTYPPAGATSAPNFNNYFSYIH